MTLRQIILATANYYRVTLSEDVLEMYAEDLSDLNPMDCKAAYAMWRRNPKNRTMPLPAQIRELVSPGENVSPQMMASEIAARIMGSVVSCGWNNARAAQEQIGPVGWEIVQRQGGWNYICEHLGVTINPSAFQAQLRQQLEANLAYGVDVIDEAARRPIESRKATAELESASNVIAQLTSQQEVNGGNRGGV